MPWKESRIVDQRSQFLSCYQREEMSLTDLCYEFGISRPTAYKWILRYKEVGPEGLLDKSRKPHTCPHATVAEIENEILALRKRFPSWGARKIKAIHGLCCINWHGRQVICEFVSVTRRDQRGY